MNCRDFREIADSYLSDELIVETNHEVFQHLENCPNCRQELSTRREIREKLRVSLKTAPEFQMNPVFAKRVKADLQDAAFQKKSWFNWKVLLPAFASLLIVIGIPFFLFFQKNAPPNLFAEISEKAVERHEDCGLKHYKDWEKNIGKLSAEKISFVKSLESEGTQILEVHNCKFEGKSFIHFVLRHNGKIISVLKTASENAAVTNSNTEDSIICKREKGLQVSSFKIGEDLVFVISDMSEAENLSVARQLFDAAKI
ncbi:MAG: hypothetical protein K1X72_07540 [Pyrinomonadaceae bacterium]|nr:hypothetical protein [Pyrinomonadaceae bacterium]